MPRLLSPAAFREAQAENSDDVFLVLITLLLMPEAQDVRVVNNTENITSRGQTFIGCPFSISLPEASDQVITEATLELDNIDPSIWRAVRLLNRSIEVRLEVVLASEPDTVLISSEGLRLREATATATVITGRLVPDTIWQAGFPESDYDPAQYPGLFG